MILLYGYKTLLWQIKHSVAKLRPCSLVWNRNVETVWAAVEKVAFTALPIQREPHGLMLSRLCEPTMGGRVRILIVFREEVWSAHGQFLDWLAPRCSFKHHQFSSFKQSRIYLLVVSSFQLESLLPIKTTQECAFICIFQGTGSSVILLCVEYSLNCYQLPSPTAIFSAPSLLPNL